ncbi:MAG: DNA polymerase IV [Planctomycetota bacterium]|nr:DNA polymerase IV [Planctomycetota bacterium]
MPHRGSDLPPRTRRILHLDVDAFLASVEQARDPRLLGREVIVGGAPDSRNLVMSCSYEARAKGVRPGMMSREAVRLCPRAVFLPGDSAAATGKREEIVRLLLEVSPLVEVSSIDDVFVDLTGTARLFGAACQVAERLRHTILARTRMPVTLGLSTSRTMARLAGKLAKPGGTAELLPGHERAFLSRLPVRHLPGVGPRIGRALERFAIRTVGDLALVGREVLFASFGPSGLTLYERARGIDPEPVVASHTLGADGQLERRPPRSIRRDSTFEPEEGRREQVEAMLAYLVDRAASKLRDHDCLVGSVEISLGYVDTRPPHLRRRDPDPDRWSSVRRKPPQPTDVTDVLWEHARELFRSLPRRRALVKRVGVALLDLRASTGRQGQLFSDPDRDRAPEEGGSRADRAARLDQLVDALRRRHGFGRVLRGASLPLTESFELGEDGFVLRTPSLNQ